MMKCENMKPYRGKVLLSVFIYALLLVSCTGENYAPELTEVEAFIQAKPDSALRVLRKINAEDYSKQDKALYYLLLTQAEDQCYVKHQSDSLISLAVDYFRHSGDDLRLARSLYTNGRVEYDLGNHAEAAELYVEAMDVAKGSEDYNIQYLICSHLGTIYYKTKMSEKALAFYIKAHDFAKKSGDSASVSYTFSDMGRVYGLQQEWEKSIEMYQQSISIANRNHYIKPLYLALSELADIYSHSRDFQKSLECLSYLLENQEYEIIDKQLIYFKSGDLYRLMEKPDSAALYLKKAMKSDNLYIRSGAYESLSYLYERLGNFEEAMKYNNLNIASEDSIRKMDDQRNIAQIEMRHENKKMAAKQFRMNTFIKVSFPVFILLIIVFLVMYRKLLKKRDAEIGSHKNTIQQIGLEKEKLELKIEQQNEIKKNLVKERNTLIKQLEITQKELDELYERKKTITVDEARIMLSRIKKTKKLTEQDWKNILVITQAIHDNFIDNFKGENPQLKKDDIKVCCLLKVGFTKKDIIELLDLSEDAMNKRMQRLKARMSIKKKWKKNELEQYISDF